MRRGKRPAWSAVLALAVAAALAAPTASAGEEGLRESLLESSAPEDEPYRPGPAQALVASAAYPGLGQLLNGSEHKAAIVGGVEAFLISRLVLEDRRTRHALRLYRETQESVYFEEYSERFDTRQTLMWWVVVAALYGIADAYVDAHLVSFSDMTPPSFDDLSEAPGGAGGALRIGLACRF